MPVKRTAPAFLFVLLVLAFAPVARAQCVPLNTLGAPYNQDFNTLSNTVGSTTNNLTIPGWFMTEAGGGARDNEQYAVDNGGSATGDTFSYGIAAPNPGSGDRALGGLQSGTLIPTIGACFTNNTGVTVTNLTIAYTGEEWRLGTAARTDQLDFEYSLNATSLTTGTWTAVNPLDFVTPNTVAPTGLKDGNNASFRTAISSSISPVSIANGATFWIRWLDLNASSNDDGLAVDDFSLTPSVADVAPSVLTTTPPNGATGVAVGANIDITFSEPVNVSPGWFSISCTVSGLHAANESGGPTTFTLDPTVNFVTNEVCTVTIDDLSVADQDANDPPNNMAADFVWSFDTTPPPPLVVNEFDYDQPGTDAAEFVEIRNNGGAAVNLDPVAVELVNGNLGGATVYQTIDLPNVVLAPGAYYVICANNTTTPNCNLDVSPNTDLIQNGAPDAVALRWNGVLVDTVSYEGDTGAPYTEGTGSGLDDNNTDAYLGISRLPDGGDTGVNNTDLSERCITPGAANSASTTPCSAPAILGISINDVTAAEGQAPGTRTFSFTVSLSQPAPPGGVTFDITTADGTAQDDTPATEDNDYVAKTLTSQNIPENATQYTFDVTVNSDVTVEPDETFFVNLSNVVGAPVGDPQGLGTIQNDDFAAITLIHTIQGAGTSSPEVGNVHTVHAVVTGVKSNGFFVQEEDSQAAIEGNPATSEGIFVFTSSAPPAAAAMGNLVYVTGTVAEFVPGSDPQQPPVTELTSPSTVLDITGLPLPVPIALSPTFPDPAGPHDQLERVEGMRVSATSITVSGPSDGSIIENTNTGTSNGRFHGVVTGVARPFREPGIQAPDVPPTGTIPPIPRWDSNPERLRIESATINSQPILTVKSGDVVGPVVGPLDYGFRGYAIYPDGTAGTPVVTPGTLNTTVTDPLGHEITVATFNMFHFFDDVSSGDGSGTLQTAAYNDRLNKASIAIRNHLKFPDILGVQELDDINTLTDLANKINADAVANSQPNPLYAAHLMEGNDVGGIDVGYLVKTADVGGGVDRVAVSSVTQIGLNTTWIDPRDGSTDLLHDRPSLVLEATVNRAPGVSFPIVVVNNHLKSLIGIDDNTVNGATTEGDRNRQKRREQAKDIANYLQGRLTSNPNEHIVLIGDFNAFEFNDGYVDPISIMSGTPTPDPETVVPADGADLVNPDFVNLVNTPPPAERYSYVHDGNAQNLDHVIVSAGIVADTAARRIERPRIDADYPETERMNPATPFRISDHEPTVGYLTINALLLADVSMTKTLTTSGPFFEGQSVTYTLTVANAGPDAATNIQVTDTPTNLSITSVSSTNCSSLPCTIPSLNAGSNEVITVTATIVAPGAFDNSADANAAEPDPDSANNTDNTGNGDTAGATANLSVTKTLDTAGPYYAGNSVTFTITVANAGPSTATNINVTDTPTNLTITSVSGACTSFSPCTIASIASGADATITVMATIDAAGAFDNSASATATENDPNGADNTDNAGDTASASADVSVTKTLDTVAPYTIGQSVTFTIVVANAGPSTATTIQVTDTPTNLTITNVSGSGCSSLPCTIAALASGASTNITVTATIDSSGAFSNAASANAAESDPNGSDNSSSDGDVASQTGVVEVTKTVSGTFVQGTNVTYTIVMTNNMTVTQPDNFGHELTDIIPAALTPVSANADSGTAAIVVGDTLVWNGSIPSGGTVTITVVATISPTATGTICNQGQSIFDKDGDNQNESSELTDDPNTVAVNDSTCFTVLQANVVETTKSVSGTFVQGTNVTYTIVMTNNMTVTQPDNFGHEWTDILPAGLTIVAGSLTASSGTIVHCCGTPGIVFWDGSIPSGGTVTLTFQATISPTASGQICNQGQSIFDKDGDGQNESSELTDDPSTGPANDPTCFYVVQANVVEVTKAVSGTFVQGTNVTYTIVMTNNMTVTQPDNFGHEFTDILPAGLTLVPGSFTATSGTNGSVANIFFWDGSIPSGGTVTLTFQATISPTASGQICNQGQSIFDRNGDGQNEAEEKTDDPSTAADDDFTCFYVVQSNVVEVTKAVSGTFVQGTNVTYTIVMTNNMTVTQPDNFGHEFTDNLPAGLTLVPGSFTATSGTNGSVANIFFWDGSIPSGGTVTLTFQATIGATASGQICNQGQSIFDRNGDGQNEASELTDDPSTAATNDATCFNVGQSNVVEVTKAVSGSFLQGTNVTYTIVLTNNMTVTQPDNFGHEFTDNLPAGLTLVGGSFTATSGTTGSVANIFFWDGSIPSGGTVTLTFAATISPTATGQICNQGQSIFDRNGDGQNEASELTDDPSTAAVNDPTCFTVIAETDTDGDGVDDIIEQAAPNGGDGNGDGIPDYQQSTVASIPAATGSGYLTLQSSCTLQQVSVTTEDAMPQNDHGHGYPHGLIAFRAPCSTATFSLFVYGSGAVSSYRKFGPLPPGGPQQWYGIPATFTVTTVGSLHPRRIDFTLTDGQTGDDTPVDGVIVDQGGPAGPNDIPTASEWGLIALAMALAAFAALKLRT